MTGGKFLELLIQYNSGRMAISEYFNKPFSQKNLKLFAEFFTDYDKSGIYRGSEKGEPKHSDETLANAINDAFLSGIISNALLFHGLAQPVKAMRIVQSIEGHHLDRLKNQIEKGFYSYEPKFNTWLNLQIFKKNERRK